MTISMLASLKAVRPSDRGELGGKKCPDGSNLIVEKLAERYLRAAVLIVAGFLLPVGERAPISLWKVVFGNMFRLHAN
jgi:hypothetical protein